MYQNGDQDSVDMTTVAKQMCQGDDRLASDNHEFKLFLEDFHWFKLLFTARSGRSSWAQQEFSKNWRLADMQMYSPRLVPE